MFPTREDKISVYTILLVKGESQSLPHVCGICLSVRLTQNNA